MASGIESCHAPQEQFVQVGGVHMSVLKLGCLREASPGKGRILILIIPGNPGVPHFYADFMQELHLHSGKQVPIWTLGHVGHLNPPGKSLSLNDTCSTEENLYGLEAQIAHKVAFIKDNIPSDVSLILIGHSIGCYMILNMLDELPDEQVLRCFMLFPTIERMSVSPNGQRMTPVFLYLRWLIVVAAVFVVMIPQALRIRLIQWYYRDKDCPTSVQNAMLKTLTPWTANFTTYLAKLEMRKVTTVQKDLIRRHMKLLSFYYGASDHWTPVQYYYDIKEEFPQLDAQLCTKNFKHAFVVVGRESQQMAGIVWEWALSHHQSALLSLGT